MLVASVEAGVVGVVAARLMGSEQKQRRQNRRRLWDLDMGGELVCSRILSVLDLDVAFLSVSHDIELDCVQQIAAECRYNTGNLLVFVGNNNKKKKKRKEKKEENKKKKKQQ